jgi:hypothetical protein
MVKFEVEVEEVEIEVEVEVEENLRVQVEDTGLQGLSPSIMGRIKRIGLVGAFVFLKLSR